MKKFLLFSITVVLALAIAFTAISVKGPGPRMTAGTICTNVGWNTSPNVGWNTHPASCIAIPLVSFLGLDSYKLPPGLIPNVGWNS